MIRCLFLCGCVALAGCRPGVGSLDARDEAVPLLSRAADAVRAGDAETAIELYRRGLEANPQAAKGHLDFAIYLHDDRKAYVDAIHHYRAYLRLRPSTEKREMIEERIRIARQSFAARELPEHRDAARAIARLERENRALRARVAQLEATQTDPGIATDNNAHRELGTPPDAPNTGNRTYTVQPGDTLSSIAVRHYGDPGKWKAIVEANRDALNGGDTIRVGQQLTLP